MDIQRNILIQAHLKTGNFAIKMKHYLHSDRNRLTIIGESSLLLPNLGTDEINIIEHKAITIITDNLKLQEKRLGVRKCAELEKAILRHSRIDMLEKVRVFETFDISRWNFCGCARLKK